MAEIIRKKVGTNRAGSCIIKKYLQYHTDRSVQMKRIYRRMGWMLAACLFLTIPGMGSRVQAEEIQNTDKLETGVIETGQPEGGAAESGTTEGSAAESGTTEGGAAGSGKTEGSETESGKAEGGAAGSGETEQDSSGTGEPQKDAAEAEGTEGEAPENEVLKADEFAEERAALQELLSEHTVMALVYLSDEYTVREAADAESGAVVTVSSGQQVQIQDFAFDEEEMLWYEVLLYSGSGTYTGYVERTNLACSDEKFLAWEEETGLSLTAASIATFGLTETRSYADVEQFPSSYQAALNSLKAQHPNWTFVKMNTNLDWGTVVVNELWGGRSLVPNSYPAYMKEGNYGQGWSYASEGILSYYLDPRNFLNEDRIFQFEQLTYNGTYHMEAAVGQILKGTFMDGVNPPGTNKTYAAAFWEVGSDLGVSPFHLASRVRQEQGAGTSPLISGTYPGYEGYYNSFNIGASGKTDEQVIKSGLEKAKKEGWKNGYDSIRGGAKTLSANYILKGQDTLYLQKFDVDPTGGLYGHQYMQNIAAPYSEALTTKTAYQNAGSLENTFVFKIPVYNNMPSSACPKPTSSTHVVLGAKSGYSELTVYLDGVPYGANIRNGRFVVNAPDTGAKTAVMYKYSSSGVPTGMSVWTLSYSGGAYTAAEVTGLEDLLTYHGFSIRITGKSGIRFKTGIAASTKASLTGSGISGYTLKEYGTLVMTDANRQKYPMVLGGNKVLSGISYKKGEVDKIYETVSGRQRFTSVLTGLPANQYKTAYAFRGYAVLTKGGQDITVYGPIVSRSIYSLAEQILNMGTYPSGSSQDTFLRKIISDANGAS